MVRPLRRRASVQRGRPSPTLPPLRDRVSPVPITWAVTRSRSLFSLPLPPPLSPLNPLALHHVPLLCCRCGCINLPPRRQSFFFCRRRRCVLPSGAGAAAVFGTPGPPSDREWSHGDACRLPSVARLVARVTVVSGARLRAGGAGWGGGGVVGRSTSTGGLRCRRPTRAFSSPVSVGLPWSRLPAGGSCEG